MLPFRSASVEVDFTTRDTNMPQGLAGVPEPENAQPFPDARQRPQVWCSGLVYVVLFDPKYITLVQRSLGLPVPWSLGPLGFADFE